MQMWRHTLNSARRPWRQQVSAEAGFKIRRTIEYARALRRTASLEAAGIQRNSALEFIQKFITVDLLVSEQLAWIYSHSVEIAQVASREKGYS